MYLIDGDFPFISHLLATYQHRDFIGTSLELHWNLIGTSSELRRIFAVRSPRERRLIGDVISAYLCTRIIIKILLSLLVAPNSIRVFSLLHPILYTLHQKIARWGDLFAYIK